MDAHQPLDGELEKQSVLPLQERPQTLAMVTTVFHRSTQIILCDASVVFRSLI